MSGLPSVGGVTGAVTDEVGLPQTACVVKRKLSTTYPQVVRGDPWLSTGYTPPKYLIPLGFPAQPCQPQSYPQVIHRLSTGGGPARKGPGAP